MSKVRNKGRRFTFTVYNYDKNTFEKLLEIDDVSYVIAGEEKCPETGRDHLQGYLETGRVHTIGKMRKVSAKKVGVPVHMVISLGTGKENQVYCGKDKHARVWGKLMKQGERTDSARVGERCKEVMDINEMALECPGAYLKWGSNMKGLCEIAKAKALKLELDAEFEDVELRDWQKDVLQVLENQNERQIIWIVDTEGNAGKTWFAKWLCTNRGAYYFRNGKTADIIYAFDGEEYIVGDFTRAQEERMNYQVLEIFKDGIAFSGKYKSGVKRFKKTKVVAMANFWPCMEKMSKDRWYVMSLDTGEILDGSLPRIGRDDEKG